MHLETLNDCPGTDGTIRDFLAIPGNAANVRERFYRDARRLGLSESDADDAAQFATVMMLQTADTLPDGTPCGPVRAFYRCRKWCRRTMYRGANGYKRERRRKMLAPIADMTAKANMRAGMMADNPAVIAAAIETAASRLTRAMGRNAAAIRGLTDADIRGLAMPDMRGLAEREPGESPRVVENLIGAATPDMTPRPATPGDGTEWRACGLSWVEVTPETDDGQPMVSRGRRFKMLAG